MSYRDLREYMDALRAQHELATITTAVDWDLEMGAISRRSIELHGPALLFENVEGYAGYRVLANPVGATNPRHGRFSIAMGLPKETPILRLIDEFAERSKNLIKPVLVNTGPCKEEIREGKDVNILELPVPRIHGTDGGRFVGTWHIDVVKDPDTGWVNWGMYRHMVHDETTVGWNSSPHQHGPGIFYQKYEANGKPMPMAIAIGTEPLCSIAAATGVPAGVSEVEVAGGLTGAPVELVKCETLDLEVPATSEIVLEGTVMPGERRMEGPFGEYTGYEAGGRRLLPVFRVHCITHRRNPILTLVNPGKPWEEDDVIFSIAWSAMLSNELKSRGIPFRAVYLPPPCLAVIVSTKPRYSGFVHTVASGIWSAKAGLSRPFIIVVGEDVDVTNMEDVFWCLTTRLHPGTGIHIQHHAVGSQLNPFLSRAEREAGIGPRVLFDATFPYHWRPEETPSIIDLEHAWPSDIREKVLSRWSEYGILTS